MQEKQKKNCEIVRFPGRLISQGLPKILMLKFLVAPTIQLFNPSNYLITLIEHQLTSFLNVLVGDFKNMEVVQKYA